LQAEYGVTFRLGTTVRALKTQASKLVAIQTDAGELECDCAVIALGVWTRQIARTAGIKLPIWPMQGYSMTIAATSSAPNTSITDNSKKIVFCRLGERLRTAGLADIGARYGDFRQGRFDTLLQAARDIFPVAGDYEGKVDAWTGLRPMTPHSQPIVGRSYVDGVFLNCGHGSLGWTLSTGTAVRLAEAIE
jgi:D-amino-acid dehydrogenase